MGNGKSAHRNKTACYIASRINAGWSSLAVKEFWALYDNNYERVCCLTVAMVTICCQPLPQQSYQKMPLIVYLLLC
jgi:hypothetical protein